MSDITLAIDKRQTALQEHLIYYYSKRAKKVISSYMDTTKRCSEERMVNPVENEKSSQRR